MKPWSYDAIASVYATDMGSSMPFDDVDWYRQRCLGRRTLELGCGTGRILLRLLAAGIDAVGIDRSLPMLVELRRQAATQGLDARVAQADLQALPLAGSFDTILMPYALATYVTEPAALSDLLVRLAALFADGGDLIIDSFVPRPVEAFDDFRLDYRRPHQEGCLERSKRITPLADGCNRIERRYRLLDGDGLPVDQWDTIETIRPYSEAQVHGLAAAAGWVVVERTDDYGQGDSDAPRFWTLRLRRR